MSINTVTISGNLTRNAELRSTQTDRKVLAFAVAVNDYRRNPDTGDWEEQPNYVECAMFGPRAEALSKYLRRGTKVALKGHLHWSQWEREGARRSKLEVVADELEFMSPRRAPEEGVRQLSMTADHIVGEAAPDELMPGEASPNVSGSDVPALGEVGSAPDAPSSGDPAPGGPASPVAQAVA
ncbi:MAG: single-stranded DNA-binding protein [Eggerthellaceae bacterium]|nr:single-stranded DNA-binding protein [Eggerthellaceae bacterium]